MITLTVTLKVKLKPNADTLTGAEFSALRDIKAQCETLVEQARDEAEERIKKVLASIPNDTLSLESTESKARANIQC